MTNLWQPVRALTASAVILILYMAQRPVAIAGTNGTASTQAMAASTTATQQANATVDATGLTTTKLKTEAVTKPREKSILDADVLDSPISYLRDAFSSESDDIEAPIRSNAVMMTVKALVASLLSTII